MARPASETQYRNVLVSIWADERVTQLPRTAQCMYLQLLTQPDVSACGVLPMRLTRWSSLSADESPSSCRASAATLENAGLVLVDDQTEEVWIRDYVRHDNGLRSPNQAKGVRAAHERVTSELIHAAIKGEYADLIDSVVQPFELKSVGRPFEDSSKMVASPTSRQAASTKPVNRQAAAAASHAVNDADEIEPAIRDAAKAAAAAKEFHPPENIKNVRAWVKAIERKILKEQLDDMREYLAKNPDADHWTLAVEVLAAPEAGIRTLRRQAGQVVA